MCEMKCPICQNNLHKINIVVSTCTNDKCKLWGSPIPNLVLEALSQAKQDLERTRKALDDAKKWLMKIGYLDMTEHGLGSEPMMTDWCKTVALHGLKEIETALEQKE